MLDYQTLEQLTCKLSASNDAISQFGCYLHFEHDLPPGSLAFTQFSDGLSGAAMTITVIIGFVLVMLRAGRSKPPPRRWIDRF